MINDNELYIFKDFLSSEECDEYYKKIYDIGPQPQMLDFKIITADLTGDPIGEKVKNFINKKFLINLDLDQLQIQDLRQVYANTTLSSYVSTDPIAIVNEKLNQINLKKKQILIELEQLKNG